MTFGARLLIGLHHIGIHTDIIVFKWISWCGTLFEKRRTHESR